MTERDIKFRAWINSLEQYEDVLKIDWIMEKIMLYEKGWFDFDDVELEQYTEFRDVNGVEIYDGDYLANERGKSRMIFKVEWFNGAWWVIPVTQYGSSQTLSQYMNRTVEIIGNGHMNPELLEV